MPRLPPELVPPPPDDDDPLTSIGQAFNIAEIDRLGCGEWTTLYEYQSHDDSSRCFYSALLSETQVATALNQISWDLSVGDGASGFCQSYEGDQEITLYRRFGYDGVEAILYSRHFHGIKPRQFDLSEEFRLFHNLYHDRQNDRYIHIDDRGREVVTAEILPSCVRVLTRFIRQYMAARQMSLALFFDHRVHARIDTELAKATLPNQEVSMADRRYSYHVGDGGERAFSRLIGKKIISPPPVIESGIWPYDKEQPQKYADFIIGVGSDGSQVFHSCADDDLANYFGANEDAPHYLTPVWFKRDVLVKYYDDPDKYSIEDGYLSCASLWGIQIDNNLSDNVMVYLGDLGRDLDYEEQCYWKHFNVPPVDLRASETNYKRSFLGQFSDPTAPDLVFKLRYEEVKEAWMKTFGWSIFRPAHKDDGHVIKQLRIPISESHGEFDTQILFLTKLLIDSLNESELVKVCGRALPEERGISKLKRFLEKSSYPHIDRDIDLLLSLQNLRSSGAAHTKGKRFDQIRRKVGLDQKTPREVFRELIANANKMLVDLTNHANQQA